MSKKAINQTVELINLFWQLEKEDMESGEPDPLHRYHDSKMKAIEVLHILGEDVEYDAREDEYLLLEEVDYDDYSSNMCCDNTGLCNGTNCPNFHKCKG